MNSLVLYFLLKNYKSFHAYLRPDEILKSKLKIKSGVFPLDGGIDLYRKELREKITDKQEDGDVVLAVVPDLWKYKLPWWTHAGFGRWPDKKSAL